MPATANYLVHDANAASVLVAAKKGAPQTCGGRGGGRASQSDGPVTTVIPLNTGTALTLYMGGRR